MIVGITGTDGAGKGTVVDYLVEKKGFTHYSARALITEEIKKRGLEVHRPNMKLVGNDLRATYGGDMIVKKSLEEKRNSGVTDCIIESLRTVAEVDTLHAEGGVLLAVDADEQLRYERISGRGSATDNLTFEQFVQQEQAESESSDPNEQNKTKVMAMADHTFTNDGTLEALHAQIDAWLETVSS